MIVPPWAKAAVLFAIVASIFYAGRVHERRIWERDAARNEAQQTKHNAAEQLAGAQFLLSLAQSGTVAVTNYVERLEKDRPVVVRTVELVRYLCMRGEAGKTSAAGARGGSGSAQEAGRQAAHGGDPARAGPDRRRAELLERRDALIVAFQAAIPGDIEVCQAELGRLDSSAAYLRKLDGEQ